MPSLLKSNGGKFHLAYTHIVTCNRLLGLLDGRVTVAHRCQLTEQFFRRSVLRKFVLLTLSVPGQTRLSHYMGTDYATRKHLNHC